MKCLVGTFGVLAVAAFISSPDSSRHLVPDARARLRQLPPEVNIDGYRNWTRVNPVPQRMDIATATLCAPAAMPAGPDAGQQINRSPHTGKFITVYVNEAGRHAMMSEAHPVFPPGSVVVKEKLPARDAATPELLTVMVKREAGFNPDSGDWEYLVLNGAGTQVEARGRLQSCHACHVQHAATDYVTRTYLPREVRERLK